MKKGTAIHPSAFILHPWRSRLFTLLAAISLLLLLAFAIEAMCSHWVASGPDEAIRAAADRFAEQEAAVGIRAIWFRRTVAEIEFALSQGREIAPDKLHEFLGQPDVIDRAGGFDERQAWICGSPSNATEIIVVHRNKKWIYFEHCAVDQATVLAWPALYDALRARGYEVSRATSGPSSQAAAK